MRWSSAGDQRVSVTDLIFVPAFLWVRGCMGAAAWRLCRRSGWALGRALRWHTALARVRDTPNEGLHKTLLHALPGRLEGSRSMWHSSSTGQLLRACSVAHCSLRPGTVISTPQQFVSAALKRGTTLLDPLVNSKRAGLEHSPLEHPTLPAGLAAVPNVPHSVPVNDPIHTSTVHWHENQRCSGCHLP